MKALYGFIRWILSKQAESQPHNQPRANSEAQPFAYSPAYEDSFGTFNPREPGYSWQSRTAGSRRTPRSERPPAGGKVPEFGRQQAGGASGRHTPQGLILSLNTHSTLMRPPAPSMRKSLLTSSTPDQVTVELSSLGSTAGIHPRILTPSLKDQTRPTLPDLSSPLFHPRSRPNKRYAGFWMTG